MRKKVMIFGGGGYNAIQVYEALKNSLLFEPILASSYDNHSTFIDSNAIINLPYTYEASFIEVLNQCIQEQQFEFIIPAHDSAALTLMEHEEEIEARIVCSCLETTRICRFKSLTYQVLSGMRFLPEIYTVDSFKLPCFMKDDEGQGGQNAYKIENELELKQHLKEKHQFVICEYLPGSEITIDCFTDRHGNLCFAQARTRERILNGISARSRTIPMTKELHQIVEGIAQKICFRGYWFIQCKQNQEGSYKLMEISTRFSGTFGVSKNLDVNLPLLALCDFSEMDIHITPNQYNICADKTYIDRYKIELDYERVYIDFDDTLVFHRERFNTEAMQFVYQCLNEKKELVLITKHEYDIYDTMQTLKLNKDIFSEIIEVPVTEMKYQYMDTKRDSIFIDNAYTERKLVKEHLGIPTFDVSNIECLIKEF